MFTAFMVALTLTTVANVLVTHGARPAVHRAGGAHLHRPPAAARTWAAIAVAGAGIAWMYGCAAARGRRSWRARWWRCACPWPAPSTGRCSRASSAGRASVDLVPAVLIGAVISALVTLPLACPFQATGARPRRCWRLLGVVQLAIPCVLSVRLRPRAEGARDRAAGAAGGDLRHPAGLARRRRSAGPAALTGGALVIGALVANELVGWRQTSMTAAATAEYRWRVVAEVAAASASSR